MRKLKTGAIVSFALSFAALVTGAAFHGYRLHPENVQRYKLGVTMGIVMLSLFAVLLVAGILLLIISKARQQLPRR